MTTKAASNSAAEFPTGGSGEMFDRIAARYDLVNRLISFGADQRWRRKTVDALQLPLRGHVLDLACGTADLSLAIAARGAELHVVGVDPSVGMLEVGRRKIASQALADRVVLEEGDAQTLRFDDDSFDGCTIAFGIRNVPDRSRALREMARVTKAGSNVCVLELSEPGGSLIGAAARFHVHHVVPWLGSVISGDQEYRYLHKSIAAFPPAREFAALMEAANLRVTQVTALTFGVCHLYVATPNKPRRP